LKSSGSARATARKDNTTASITAKPHRLEGNNPIVDRSWGAELRPEVTGM
jgi:hypothetical protein